MRPGHVPWGTEEVAYLLKRTAEGVQAPTLVREINTLFHGGAVVRNNRAVNTKRNAMGVLIGRAGAEPAPEAPEQSVKTTTASDGSQEILAVGRRIRTVEDAIAHVEADMTRFEIDKVETSAFDAIAKDAEGKIRQIQNFRVWVRLKPKAGPNVREEVDAMLAGAFAIRKPVRIAKPKRNGNPDILQAIAVADPHIGKLAWPAETGGQPWDTPISVETIHAGVAHLMSEGEGVGERAFCLLGDYLHHDGKGMTTQGTPLDYDSRVPKLLRAGTELIFDLIAASAEKVPTRVYVVPGNHDQILTWALQELIRNEFRKHGGVMVDDRFTSTKFFSWGRCLIGLDHGDKGKKRLPNTMVTQCEAEWGQSIVREILTGHLHSKAAIETMGGIVVRTMDSLSSPDKWHADEKFHAPRTIEAFRYDRGGMLAGTDSWSPDMKRAPRKGTA